MSVSVCAQTTTVYSTERLYKTMSQDIFTIYIDMHKLKRIDWIHFTQILATKMQLLYILEPIQHTVCRRWM